MERYHIFLDSMEVIDNKANKKDDKIEKWVRNGLEKFDKLFCLKRSDQQVNSYGKTTTTGSGK
jgi:hypothetical protein